MELDKYGTAGDIQELLAIRDRIDTLLDSQTGDEALTPRADLLDAGDAYHLIVEVPGVPQENLEIALQDREVIIAGIREPLDGDEGVKLLFGERPSGHFQRTLTLPGEVDRIEATAHLRDGLLILTLPKI
ncbi:MAG: Hsp20/alpha crystallin family protein [Truepera sp.]|nr:Hsp20/alpha crystallin family protein [Truepera sp.]